MPIIQFTENAHFKHIVVKTPHYCIELINRGATVKALKTPNRDGTFENIILTYDDIDDYQTNKKMLGATVGPYAGRIQSPYPAFFQQAPSQNVLLHSGSDNLALQDFDVKVESNQVIFTLDAMHVFTMFPKQFQFKVIYTFKQAGFSITFETHAFEEGVSNITNHMYFNLSGALHHTIYDHELCIPASQFCVLNQEGLPQKQLQVHKTPFDFQKAKPLRDALTQLIKKNIGGLDHPFILEDQPITLYEPISGRRVMIETDYDALVVFTNNEATNATLANGSKDQKHGAICLEPQHMPNDIHFLKVPKSVMQANALKRQTITYTFSTT